MNTRTHLRRRLLPALAAAALGAALMPGQGAAAVTGTRSVLVVLTQWAGAPPDSVTQASAANLVAQDVDGWYREVSDGQLGFKGAATPWLTLPDGQNPCSDAAGYRSAAEAAAEAAGYAVGDYQHVVMYSTHRGCPNFATQNGSSVWILGGSLILRVLAHELGHNLGLQHADLLGCGQSTPFKTSGCTSLPQGDFLDNMGGALGTAAPHFGAGNQDKLGWLGGGRKATAPAGATTYRINPIETQGAVLQAVKVTAAGRDWWIEYRQPTGADAYLGPWPGATNGVIIRTPGGYTTSYAGTWLLDMTPSASAIQAALPFGKSWTHPSGKLKITAVKKTGAGKAQVKVEVK